MSKQGFVVLLGRLFFVCLLLLILNCGGGEGGSAGEPALEDVGALPQNPSRAFQPPVLSGAPLKEITADKYYSYRPTIVSGDLDSVIFSVSNKPDWAWFNASTGRLHGRPTIADIGTYLRIEISVRNAGGEFTAEPFDLEVVEPLPPVPPAPVRVQNPGHYIAINAWDNEAEILDALRPGVQGLQIRYAWKTLEPQLDQYDFSAVQSHLDLLAAQGKRLVVFIEDKTFNGEIPTPEYMGWFTRPNRAGGYTALRWKPGVITRLSRLIDELGQRFDDHPAFEGIALQETAPSFTRDTLDANAYTPELYRDALIEILLSAADSLPTSTVFWYMNFLPQNNQYIADVANAVAPSGVTMGGPDVLPDSYDLKNLSYPFYDQFKNKMILFNSIQYDSYYHRHADTSYPTTYWTMPELYEFARDDLHINYLFWTRKASPEPPDSYTWIDALPVIEANPQINP